MIKYSARTDDYVEKCVLYIPTNMVDYKIFKDRIAMSEQEVRQKVYLLNKNLVN